MPSSLSSPSMADMPDIINTHVPDLTSTSRNNLMPHNNLSSIDSEDDITISHAAAAVDADNVSFLRASPVDDDDDDDDDNHHHENNYNVNGMTDGNRYPTNAMIRRSEQQTTSRAMVGNTNNNNSPRLRRLHSRAREIRVEDRALRDRLQRILHRLNHARDHADSDRNTLFGDEYESNWAIVAHERLTNGDFDIYAYGHPARRNQREGAARTSTNSRNNNDDVELERIAREFSLGYAGWASVPTEESTREELVARGLYRREGGGTDQAQRTEQSQHTEPLARSGRERERYTRVQHGSRRNRRLPSGIQEYLTDASRPERLALPAPVPMSANSMRPSLAQSNAALLRSASQYTESPVSAASTTRPRESRWFEHRTVRYASGSRRASDTLPSISNLENELETWNPPTQEQLRHMEMTLQQLERSSMEARREAGIREWQRYRLHNQLRYENEDDVTALPTASTSSERSERANHVSELEEVVESVFPGRRGQHLQDQYLGLLQHDTRLRIDAYRRRYLENPGSSLTEFFHPTPRRSTSAVAANTAGDDTLNTRANNSVTSTSTILPNLASSIPSSLPSCVTAWPEQTLRYLALLRSSAGFEESLAHAIVAGFATSEFMVENHDDFVMEAALLPRPYETSWLASGQVLCGFQKATAMSQKDRNRCRRHGNSNGARRSGTGGVNGGRDGVVSTRLYRFPNARPMTSTTLESTAITTNVRSATRARSHVTMVGPSSPISNNGERLGNSSSQQRERRRNTERLQEPEEPRQDVQQLTVQIQRAHQYGDQVEAQRLRQLLLGQIAQDIQQLELEQQEIRIQQPQGEQREQQTERREDGEQRQERQQRRQQQQNRWPVKVTIHSVDCKSMTMSATMEARNVPSYPSPAWSSVLNGSSRTVQRNSNTATTNSSASASTSISHQSPSSSTPSGLSTSAAFGLSDSSSSVANTVAELAPTYSIITYLEGELIDFHKHSLLTENYASSPEIDAMYWRRLEPFRNLTDEQFVRKLVSRSALEDIQQRYVLMRWKEQCFVRKLRSQKKDNRNRATGPDSEMEHNGKHNRYCEDDVTGQVDQSSCNSGSDNGANEDDTDDSDAFEDVDPSEPDSACGLTISGFYYVCLRRSDGALEGLYYDPQSSPYQRLYLQPGFGDGGGSKRAGQLRRKVRRWGQADKAGKLRGTKKNGGGKAAKVRPPGRVGDDDDDDDDDHEDDDDEEEDDEESIWRNGTGISGVGKGALGVFPNSVFR